MTYKRTLLKFSALLILGFQSFQVQAGLFTNLGADGNAYVRDRFNAYKIQNPEGQCVRQHPELPSAIVTGFGIFLGVPYNPSGAIAATMGNVQFLPESINTKKKSIINVAPETGTISNADLGGRAVSRKLTINSKQMEVCFISLDVVWDLAASIILYESQFFRPQAILMMGRQGETHEFRFEGASQNMAESIAGYDAEGKLLVAQNSPQEQAILNHEPLNAQVKFNWKAESLAKSAKSLLKGTEFTTTFETQAGWEDSYLCNNVSYVIASATQNKPIVLAGGQIIMPEMILNTKTRFGFLHLPAVDQTEPKLSIETAELFARVVSHTLFTLMK